MADIKETVEDENRINTVLADDIEFTGTLKFKNSLKIKGNIKGKIETTGQLIIGREATVSAEVTAGVVSINGTLNGKINAATKVEIFKKSKTSGDMITPDLYIEPGSIFNGTCIMKNS